MAETPKPGDTRLASSSAVVVGSNRIAAEEALRNLAEHGYAGRVHTLSLVGDVEEAAARVVSVAHSELALCGPRCVILAGETTVQFGRAVAVGAAGKGGRCSHMALLVAQALSGVPNWCAPLRTEPPAQWLFCHGILARLTTMRTQSARRGSLWRSALGVWSPPREPVPTRCLAGR